MANSPHAPTPALKTHLPFVSVELSTDCAQVSLNKTFLSSLALSNINFVLTTFIFKRRPYSSPQLTPGLASELALGNER